MKLGKSIALISMFACLTGCGAPIWHVPPPMLNDRASAGSGADRLFSEHSPVAHSPENLHTIPTDRSPRPTARENPQFKIAQSADEAEDQLSEFGRRWFYGPGLGTSLANVGTVVAFPPYAIYLLGNAGLTLAGYEPLFVTSALPEKPRSIVLGVYDGIVSVPGRITSVIAGEEYSNGDVTVVETAAPESTPDENERTALVASHRGTRSE